MGDPWGFAEWGGLEGLSCSGATIANDYTCTALLSSRYVCAAKNAKKIKAQKKCKKSLALPALHCGAVHKKQWEVVGGSALCQDLPPVCLSSPRLRRHLHPRQRHNLRHQHHQDKRRATNC